MRVPRARALGAVADAAVVLVEGPDGTGKSTFVAQLTDGATVVRVDLTGTGPDGVGARLSAAVRRAGLVAAPPDELDALVGALARAEPATVLVDDVHALAPTTAEVLAAALVDIGRHHRVVVVGRHLDGLDPLAVVPGAAHVGPDDLALDVHEVADLLGVAPASPLAREVHEVTGGWAVAVDQVAARIRAEPRWSPSGAGLRSVLVPLVAAAVAAQPLLPVLAALPLVDDEVVARASTTLGLPAPEGLAVPYHRRGRWVVVAAPLADLLAAPVPTALARTVLDHYLDRGEADAAARLAAAGDPDLLRSVVGRVRWTEWTEVDDRVLDDLARKAASVPDVEAALLLDLARAIEHRDGGRRRQWLDRAVGAAATGTDRRLARAVDAERARTLVRAAALDEGRDLAVTVLGEAGDDEHAARGRAASAIAMADAVACTPEAFDRAAGMYERSADHLRSAGETAWQSDSLARLGYTTRFLAGRVHAGVEALERSLSLLPVGDLTRARWLTNAADAYDVAGRQEEAESALREAFEIGRRREDPATIGMAWWTRSWLDARRGDRQGLLDALTALDRDLDRWVGPGQRVEVEASSVEHLLLVDEPEAAARWLDRAEQTATPIGYREPVVQARAAHLALAGDPAEAVALLDRTEQDRAVLPIGRPRRLLFRAVALARLGDAAGAERAVAEAERMAAGFGVPDLNHRHHPFLLARAGTGPATAPPGGGSTADADGGPTRVHIRLLGDFAVEVDGRDRTPAPGQASTVMKVLALRGPLPAEVLVDLLWPDAEPRVGATRLRRVLHRLRDQSGPVVARRGAVIALDARARVDVAVFADAATAAVAAPAEERAGRARAALAAYTGDLLPGDLYEDWAALDRDRARRLRLSLLDVLATAAADRGDGEELVRVLDLALEADPLDAGRAERLVRALEEQGRRAEAARARAHAADLR